METLTPLTYLDRTRQPLHCLVFILPILVTYEMGVRIINYGSNVPRINGADALIKQGLQMLGVYGSILSACLIVATLLFLHAHSRQSWRFSIPAVLIMGIESAVLALPLFPLGAAVRAVTDPSAALPMSWPSVMQGFSRDVVYMLGAGVYEEFLFRLLLLGGMLAFATNVLGCKGFRSQMTALLISALAFAAIHHIGPEGDPITPYYFGFRTIAGVYFGWLFLVRGYGIAAGTHTWYNLFVKISVLINSSPA